MSTNSTDSVVKDWTGPLDNSLATREEVRSTGGFFPEQQTFLGATIKSFSAQAGGGSSPTTLNVELIVDPNGTNPTIDDPSKSKGVYDPYHTGTDAFSPPGVGMPVFFVYSNPRATIRDAFEGNSTGSVLKFGGLLQSFHSTSSISGHSYSVTVVDPREILSNIYLILNHSDDKVGEVENNVYNVFGFLEYNPTLSTRSIFKSYTKNIASRGTNGLAGDDMYYSGAAVGDSYFSNPGYQNKFPVTGTAMSRRSSSGIPYYRIMQALAAMNSALPSSEYSGFSGGIYYRGLSYYISFHNLPALNPLYFFDQDNIDLLAFVMEIAESCGYEMDVSLSPYFGNDTGVGGTISINFIDRSNESAVGQINSFINNTGNFPVHTSDDGNTYSLLEKTDIGYELTNPTTSKVLFGANRVDLYAFTSSHDGGAYHGGGGAGNLDQIIPFYGTLSGNVVVPVKGSGPWKQILLDSSGVGAFGVGNYYVATETELRYALKGFKAWKNFLEFYNARFLEVVNKNPKYSETLIGNGISVQDDENGDHIKGLKAPRCLFTNDAGYGAGGMLLNPCCPPFGYPLYYNRAVALGLTVKKVFDERASVVADLRVLSSLEGSSNPAGVAQVVNALLEKYKQLRKVRKLSQAENDAVKIISSQGAGVDSAYLDSIISSMSGQMVIVKKNVETRKENAQKVFNFVKSVAEECYGKKWLVRLPPKPNYKFGVPKLSADKKTYEEGPFGFYPIGNGDLSAAANNGSFVEASNNPVFTAAQSQFKSGLISTYNPIDDSLNYNYIPDSAGGFVSLDVYNLGVTSALMPANLQGFGANHRIKTYVRYDYAENLNVSSANSRVYTEPVGNRIIPQTDPNNSAQMIAFIPAELDTQVYYLPVTHTRSVMQCNGKRPVTYHMPLPVNLDASGNVPDGAGQLKTNIQYEPLFSGSNVNISDFPRSNNGQIIPYPNLDYAYALITIGSVVSPKRDSLADIPKKQKFNTAAYPSYFTDNDTLGTVTDISISRKIDLDNYGSSLTFYNPDRLFSVPPCVKPDLAVLPLENQQSCYGPWYSGPVKFKNLQGQDEYKLLKNIGGKVDIQTDGSLAPWNFGSYGLMNTAANSRVSLAGTLYLASEKGSVSYPGMPHGNVDIGNLISTGGPILDSISLDVGIDGVRCSYRFQTYSRSMAHVQRQQQKQIDIVKNQYLKNSAAQFDLFSKSLIKNKFKGPPPPAQVLKPYVSAIDPNYTSPGTNNLSISSVSSVGQETAFQSSVASSESMQEVLEQDNDTLSQYRDRYNSALENLSDQKIAVSRQHHHLLPSMRAADLEQLESLYDSPLDPFNRDEHHITYWS